MQDKKQQLELDIEYGTGSILGKEYIKAIYCHPAYLYAENIVQNAALSEAQLDSRLLEEISTTSDMQRTPLNWQKVMRTKEPLDECERVKKLA